MSTTMVITKQYRNVTGGPSWDYLPVWENYRRSIMRDLDTIASPRGSIGISVDLLRDLLENWHARLENTSHDYWFLVFDTDEDRVLFQLRWS